MVSSDPPLSDSGSDASFGFAFNDPNYSDRLLRLEITHGGGGGGGEASCSSDDGCVRVRKRRRVYDENQTQLEEENNEHEEEAVLMTTHSGVSVEELHISSLLLAAKSPFFHKLFSNGMRESEQRQATLKIDASEKAAVMELLKFMYSNSLSVTETPALLDVLIAADKFQVASCLKYCTRLLLSSPMTFETALFLLDHPSTLSMTNSIKPLTNAATQFLISRYKGLRISKEEVKALPLLGIQAILSSDDLQVPSEDNVYAFAVAWAKLHYSVVEKRQEILGSHLAPYIRFPHMTCGRLMKILTSDDFKPPVATELVLQALNYKAESSNRQRDIIAIKQSASHYRWFVERAYRLRPIKSVVFKVPRHQCLVYWDLTRKECESLYPLERIQSQTFEFGGQEFFLLSKLYIDQTSSTYCFGLYIGMQGEEGSVSLTLDYQFSVRLKATEEFVEKFKAKYTFAGGKIIGSRNLLEVPWEVIMCKDSLYFINDILHLRAKLTICQD